MVIVQLLGKGVIFNWEGKNVDEMFVYKVELLRLTKPVL